jgi:hypothetical protein
MDLSISTSPPVAVTKLTMTPAREWFGAIAGATLTKIGEVRRQVARGVNYTDAHTLQRLSANLKRP